MSQSSVGMFAAVSSVGMFAAVKTEVFLKVPILYWRWEIT